jgi:hypothetical protein
VPKKALPTMGWKFLMKAIEKDQEQQPSNSQIPIVDERIFEKEDRNYGP